MAKVDEGTTIEDLESVDEAISAPSKTGSKKKGSGSKSSGGGGRKGPLQKRLTTMIELIGDITAGLDKYDGTVIHDNAGRMAEALVELSNENPRVKRVLEGMLEGSAWAGVGGVFVWEIATPIAVHHQLLPEPINGNLANLRGIPLRKPKQQRRPDLRVVEDDEEESPDGYPVRRGQARDPETGDSVWVRLAPDGKLHTDGNGKPIDWTPDLGYEPVGDDDPETPA